MDGGGWIEWDSQRGRRGWGEGAPGLMCVWAGYQEDGCGWIEWDSRRGGKVSVWVGYLDAGGCVDERLEKGGGGRVLWSGRDSERGLVSAELLTDACPRNLLSVILCCCRRFGKCPLHLCVKRAICSCTVFCMESYSARSQQNGGLLTSDCPVALLTIRWCTVLTSKQRERAILPDQLCISFT